MFIFPGFYQPGSHYQRRHTGDTGIGDDNRFIHTTEIAGNTHRHFIKLGRSSSLIWEVSLPSTGKDVFPTLGSLYSLSWEIVTPGQHIDISFSSRNNQPAVRLSGIDAALPDRIRQGQDKELLHPGVAVQLLCQYLQPGIVYPCRHKRRIEKGSIFHPGNTRTVFTDAGEIFFRTEAQRTDDRAGGYIAVYPIFHFSLHA